MLSGLIAMVLMLLLSIALVTLLERKLLSLSQNRLGPNKVGMSGLLQPVLDGVKLFMKPQTKLEQAHQIMYKMSSYLSFSMMLLMSLVFPLSFYQSMEIMLLWILTIMGISAHLILISGWSSLSKFSSLGSIRSLAQAISYELVMTLLLILPFLLNHAMSWHMSNMSTILLFTIWNMTMLMELQRAPFDLAEGESELVSGFNTEYGGLFFVFFFLAEYGNLIVLAAISQWIWSSFSYMFIMWTMLWLLIRSCFPRIRFDQLMSSTWLIILPAMVLLWLINMMSNLL